MEVYRISGKFEQFGRWSVLPEDFSGHFAVDDDGVLRGTMTERYNSLYDDQRFIWGIKRGDELHFFKVTNEMEFDPLFYSFSDYHKEGAWGNLVTFFGGRFYLQGKCKITLTKVCLSVQKVEDVLLDMYAQMNGNGCWNFNETLEESMPLLEDLVSIIKEKIETR